MICPYGFIKCNTLLFGAVRSHLELIRRELGFRTIPLGVSTREMEKILSRPVFWIFFDDLSLWIYKM